MSATRMLILGVVRIFQPVHGYYVRRELLSWRAEQWANVNPGSIYNALRTLAREGFLEEVEQSAEQDGGRPRTCYRLTPDGLTEFTVLLQDAFWSLNEYEPDRMFAAVSFMAFLSRTEVIAALQQRVAQIEASRIGIAFKEETLRSNPNVPDHTSEILLLAQARLEGELGWARRLLERVQSGEYEFAGEGPAHRGATEPADPA